MVKTAFFCPEEIFEDIFFLFTNFSSFLDVFRLWGEHFGVFAKVMWMGCQNCFQVSMGEFRKKCFLRRNSSNWFIFLDFGYKSFGPLAKNFDGCVKTAFNVSRGVFWVNCFFYEFFQLLDCFPAVGRTFCNIGSKILEKLLKLHSIWTTKLFEENLFSEERTYYYNFFELWSKTLRTFFEKPSTRFQKLLSSLVQGIFLHNIILFLEKFYAY